MSEGPLGIIVNRPEPDMTPEMETTYRNLGIIITCTGNLDELRKGNADLSAVHSIDQELEELISFRNHLVHSTVRVDADGSINVSDPLAGDENRPCKICNNRSLPIQHTKDELRELATRYYSLRPITWNTTTWKDLLDQTRADKSQREELLSLNEMDSPIVLGKRLP